MGELTSALKNFRVSDKLLFKGRKSLKKEARSNLLQRTAEAAHSKNDIEVEERKITESQARV